MATVAYTDYLPNVRLQATGAPDSVMVDAIRDAVIRFCEDSLIWRIKNDPIDVTTVTDTYSVLPASPTGIRVVAPVQLSYNKLEIPPHTEEELDTLDSGWRTADPGVPTSYLIETVNFIRFNRVPLDAVTDGLRTRVAVKPTQAATGADELIYEDWRAAIEAGAVSVLAGQKDKPWADAGKAESEGALFNFYIQRAKARAVMGHAVKSTTVQMRPWI